MILSTIYKAHDWIIGNDVNDGTACVCVVSAHVCVMYVFICNLRAKPFHCGFAFRHLKNWKFLFQTILSLLMQLASGHWALVTVHYVALISWENIKHCKVLCYFNLYQFNVLKVSPLWSDVNGGSHKSPSLKSSHLLVTASHYFIWMLLGVPASACCHSTTKILWLVYYCYPINENTLL